ncbi:hypothetical protein ES703_05108 [subsurface metagenome]
MINVLSQGEAEKLSLFNFIPFYSYSDNILESWELISLIIEYSEFLEFLGVFAEQIDQPIYFFKIKNANKNIGIKICGKYENWDLPEQVSKIINYIDKLDIVITDKDTKPILAIETTGTANVGNSQWQREGRKIGAAINKTPMVYQTFYAGTDRSQENDVVREATCLQVLNHLMYSLRYKIGSFVVYYSDPDIDSMININRSSKNGKKNLANFVSLTLAFKIDKKFKVLKNSYERKLLKDMLEYITESVVYRNRNIRRIDKDFSMFPSKNLICSRQNHLIDEVIKIINGEKEKADFEFTDWDFSQFVEWTKLNSKRLEGHPLIEVLKKKSFTLFESIENNKIRKIPSFFSYISDSKCAITKNTKKFFDILYNLYGKKDYLNKKIDLNKPTLFIPIRIFKGVKKVIAGDPEAGEIVAFSEMFAKDLENKKIMNIVLYCHVDPPAGFDINKELKKAKDVSGSKIFKSIINYMDILIIGEEIIQWQT